MRHRRRGRKLGRNPKHQRALLRSLASELILTERDPEHPLFDKDLSSTAPAPPRVQGRIITTVAKAKEVRPFIERCITLAKKAQAPLEAAAALESGSDYRSDGWKSWRKSDKYNEWNAAVAPAVAVRRRLIQLLGNKEAVEILIDDIAPRFEDRDGGYTRIVKLAQPRLGDAGPRAILEFVGKNDRVVKKAERPTFDDTEDEKEEEAAAEAPADEEASTEEAAESTEESAEAEEEEKS
ncbi:bL17 family ribosomal protein [Aeoliella sp.]|uniref:bL17 family ribosomal protein n=1 Tax=Aeoliella sp. TaxID=2795800 RepID=UPI003CCBC580